MLLEELSDGLFNVIFSNSAGPTESGTLGVSEDILLAAHLIAGYSERSRIKRDLSLALP